MIRRAQRRAFATVVCAMLAAALVACGAGEAAAQAKKSTKPAAPSLSTQIAQQKRRIDEQQALIESQRALLDAQSAAADSQAARLAAQTARVAALDSQLRAHAAGDRLDDVLEELKQIRIETGSPPLASPIGHLLGSQALVHVLSASRWVTVEFDANTRGLPWSFAPGSRSMRVHPGQLVHVVYEVRNEAPRPIVGQAIPSYGPKIAAGYFRKMECFCFQKQELKPGETRQMPVVATVSLLPVAFAAASTASTISAAAQRASLRHGISTVPA